MIATSGFLTALGCIKFVFGRRRHSAPDAMAVAYLPLGHLGHGPPLNSEKFLHRPMTKNATLEKFDSEENN